MSNLSQRVSELETRQSELEEKIDRLQEDIHATRVVLESRIRDGHGDMIDRIDLVDAHLTEQDRLLSDRISGRGLLWASIAGGLVGVLVGLLAHAL